MRALVLVIATGCWSGAPPSPSAVHPATPATPRAREPWPAHSVWTGRYRCTQGITAVQLTLDVERSGVVNAVFDFGALDDNPTVPAGAYRMIGRLVETSDRTSVSLSPDRWISQPDGYEMVSVELASDRGRHRMRGTISNPACSWIDVRRSD